MNDGGNVSLIAKVSDTQYLVRVTGLVGSTVSSIDITVNPNDYNDMVTEL